MMAFVVPLQAEARIVAVAASAGNVPALCTLYGPLE
jgi:hypothetical protein